MARRLDDVRLAVLMIDGLDLKAAPTWSRSGSPPTGVKVPLGLWEGSTENATVATALLSDLVDRGLDAEQGVLVVIDGGKALRAAVNDVLGPRTPVHRCVRHKERNVLDHLPERDRPRSSAGCAARGRETDYAKRSQQLQALAAELERSHPGAAASLSEGMRRDAHRHPPRRQGRAEAHAAEHQPVRVDDRVRPPHLAQRQALAVRRHVPALDRRRDARSRTTVPPNHRPRRPRQARPHRRTRDRPAHHGTHRPRRPLRSSPSNSHTRAATKVPRLPGVRPESEVDEVIAI